MFLQFLVFISVSSHLPPFNSSILDTMTVDHTDDYIIEPDLMGFRIGC